MIDCLCVNKLEASHDVQQPHIRLETCPSCFGMFFDAGEFKDFSEETFMDRVKDLLASKR